ncbi:unnamed protein product [Urochloa humidicola]
MKSLIKLFNGWEIQLLVLLSFTLQSFLFFVGNLRRHWTNIFLRFSIWMAYLGADLVAVYALGYLSRHMDATIGMDKLRGSHQLAFFWAPFLLCHLGGQDSITAFSMEDNNLWLRHLLNMVVQVVLATYIFWESIGRHNTELLISGIFVFTAGVIKYGERVWSLRCGSLESLEGSTGNHYNNMFPRFLDVDVGYSKTVRSGLCLMWKVLEVLTGRSFDIFDESMRQDAELLKLVSIELRVLHTDLYTKALVLRTRSGTILRCISQITLIVAFVTFYIAGNKQSYHRADIAITYSLFIGGLFLEICALLIFFMSPWTWAWLKDRGCDRLARFSWLLFSNDLIGWSEKKPLWSNVVGQYNLRSWLLVHSEQPRSSSRYIMIMVRKLLTIFGAKEEKLFWLSKLFGREYIKGDKLLECLKKKMLGGFSAQDGPGSIWGDQLHSIFKEEFERSDFGNLLIVMHLSTELHLSRYHCSEVKANVADSTDVSVEVCRQLSRYMMYLLVTHPSLLPLDRSAAVTLERWRQAVSKDGYGFMIKLLSIHNPTPSMEALKEYEDSWIWIIMYVAAKSRPEMHAALLARGVEPLTFFWLLLAHLRFGSVSMSGMSWYRRIDRNNDYINTGIPEVRRRSPICGI